MKVVSAPLPRRSVGVVARGGQHPLPTPFFRCAGIFPFKGVRQSNTPQPFLQVALMLLPDCLEVGPERFLDGRWKRRISVLVPLAGGRRVLGSRETGRS